MTNPPGVSGALGNGAVNVVESQLMQLLATAGMAGQFDGRPNGAPGFVSLGSRYFAPTDPSDTKFYTGAEGLKRYGKGQSIPLQTAIDEWNYLSPQDVAEFGAEVGRQEGYDIRKNPKRVGEVWRTIIPELANYQQATGNYDVGPTEFLRMVNDRNEKAGLIKAQAGGAGGYRGPVTTRSVDEIVDLTNPSQAQMLVDDSLNKYLGRNATEEERSTFLDALNQLERKNPRRQESTQTITPKGDALRISKGKSVSSGGIDPRVVAEEFAASRPEAAESMASTQYMDWFMEKLRQEPMGGLEIGA